MKEEVTDTNLYDLVDEKYFKIEWFSGTGAGGQFRNKHQNSCRVIHIPTGISESRQSRSRDSNRISAMAAVKKTLIQSKNNILQEAKSEQKKNKLGTGQRGDKVITIQFQNDKVTHHITGKTCRVKDFMNGKMNLIW
jgi:peptide chain release factor 1